jgi:hypothetical protein
MSFVIAQRGYSFPVFRAPGVIAAVSFRGPMLRHVMPCCVYVAKNK